MSKARPTQSLKEEIDKILYQIILDAVVNKDRGEQNLFMQITPEVLEKSAQKILSAIELRLDSLKKLPSERTLRTGTVVPVIWPQNRGYNQAIEDIKQILNEG